MGGKGREREKKKKGKEKKRKIMRRRGAAFSATKVVIFVVLFAAAAGTLRGAEGVEVEDEELDQFLSENEEDSFSSSSPSPSTPSTTPPPIPWNATIWGPGLSIAASGRPALFMIQPVDRFGNNITTPGMGSHFVVLVEPPSMRGVVMENGDGSLLVALTHEWGTVLNGTVAITIPAIGREEEVDQQEYQQMKLRQQQRKRRGEKEENSNSNNNNDKEEKGEEEKKKNVDDKKKKEQRLHVGTSPYHIQIVPFYSFDIEPESEAFPSLPDREAALEARRIRRESNAMEQQFVGDEDDNGRPETLAALRNIKAAFATLVVSDPFVMGALVLMHTLRKSLTAFPLVAMTTDAVSPAKRALMKHHGIIVKRVERIGNPKGDKLEEKSWDAVYTKCRAWQLIEYEKVLFMDADQVVLRNIDHLFLKQSFAAVPDLAPPTVFNSGLMLLSPSQQVFEEMMLSTHKMKSYDEGDQGFLNEFFWGRWHMLPFNYNYLKSKTGNPDAYFWYLHLQKWSIYVTHIVGVKPWVCSPFRDCGTGFQERHIPFLWELWWKEMEEVCAVGHISCIDPVEYEDFVHPVTMQQISQMPFNEQEELKRPQ